MTSRKALLPLVLGLALAITSCLPSTIPQAVPTPPPQVPPTPTLRPSPAQTPTATADHLVGALTLDSLLRYVKAFSDIQPYSGWRNSATSGELEAVEYVADVLGSFTKLTAQGMTVEQEEFNVFLATEVWDAGLQLYTDDDHYDIPVNAPRGPRDDPILAASFDSDGHPGDQARDPLEVTGPLLVLGSEHEILTLSGEEAEGKVVFLDYALVDTTLHGMAQAESRAARVIEARPAAVVLVTSWSPRVGESHGCFAYEGGVFSTVNDNRTPVVVARLEDMANAGIDELADLEKAAQATVLVDTDVLSPALSRNLVAMIPGRDSSRAVILGAHIDSPNNPGALDDGSGSATLLEIARVLDQTGYVPGVTTYLVWFGSEELYLYGSNAFVARHQELLDRSIAMIQIDCLTRPLDGLEGAVAVTYWSYGRYGTPAYPLNGFLVETAADLNIEAHGEDELGPTSDNTPFSGFDVPNGNLIYWVLDEAQAGGIHNAGFLHSPYDTPERVGESSGALMDMARLALGALVRLGEEKPELRPTETDRARAVFVGTQTEPTYMGPSALTDFAMALEHSGLDVDLIPFGASLSPDDLEGAALVVALPTIDYPSRKAGSVSQYDVAWTQQEVETLREYVVDGGLLLIPNSRHRLKYGYPPFEENEDWSDMNALAQVFGVTFYDGATWGEIGQPGDHPLVQGLETLRLAESNGVPFTCERGESLAYMYGDPVMALVPYGDLGGEVLVIGDLGILRSNWYPDTSRNLQLWVNLARYALDR